MSCLSNTRRPELDGLRGLAIILILIWHYSEFIHPAMGTVAESCLHALRLSWSGVDLFFVLSGFLIGGILIDNRRSDGYWSTFYLRRTFRILPLYLAVVATFIGVKNEWSGELPWTTDGSIPIWSYPLFLQNYYMAYQSSFGANFLGPTWSLAIEEQFYLVLPMIVRFVAPRLLPYTLVGLIALAPLSRFVAFHWFSKDHFLSNYVLMPCRADALLLGVFCAWAIRQHLILTIIAENRRAVPAAIAVLFLGVCFFGFEFEDYRQRAMVFIGFSWIALFYTAVLFASVTKTCNSINSLLLNKYLRFTGTISFALYLFHIPIIGLIHEVAFHKAPIISTIPEAEASLFALVLTFLMANLSQRYFERFFNDLGHRFSY